MAEGDYIERLLRDYANPNPTMASNSYRWISQEREFKKPAGVHELYGICMLNAKVDALSKKLEGANMVSQSHGVCELCSGMHPTSDCNFSEQVQYVQNYNRQQHNPYSNSYNSGWKTHPTFLWGGQSNQSNSGPPEFQHQEQQQPPPQPEQRQPAAWELAMEKLVVGTTSGNIESVLDQIATTTRNLEVHMGQLANSLTTRLNDALPSQTDIDPKEHCQAVVLTPVKITEKSTPKVDLHKAMEHSSIECAEEVRKICPSKPIDVCIVYSSTDHNEDPGIAAAIHELILSKTQATSVLLEQEEPDLHNKPPKQLDIKDNLGTKFSSYKKKIRRFLKNQSPKPPFEEGSKKPQVRNRRCYKGNRHRIKHYLVKMFGTYNQADSTCKVT